VRLLPEGKVLRVSSWRKRVLGFVFLATGTLAICLFPHVIRSRRPKGQAFFRALGERLKVGREEEERAEAVERGRRLLSEERYRENLEFLEEARRQFPDVAEIQLLYASMLLEFRPEDVAVEAAKAVELGPEDPTILVRAASLLLNRGQLEEARPIVKRARALVGPDFLLEGGLVNLEGVIAAIDKEYDLAEEKLRLAVELDPDFESFAGDLAKLLRIRSRPAEAVEVIDQALPQVEKKERLERLRKELVGDGDH
jgi:Flp pilus assembly protein TadD